jgi:hypothetical protein
MADDADFMAARQRTRQCCVYSENALIRYLSATLHKPISVSAAQASRLSLPRELGKDSLVLFAGVAKSWPASGPLTRNARRRRAALDFRVLPAGGPGITPKVPKHRQEARRLAIWHGRFAWDLVSMVKVRPGAQLAEKVRFTARAALVVALEIRRADLRGTGPFPSEGGSPKVVSREWSGSS